MVEEAGRYARGKVVGVRDIPIEDLTEDDEGLKVSDYAAALTEFIQKTETPITIGVQGDWGSGKTSLMNLIQKALGGKYPKIWVNTWKYAQTEPGQALAIAVFLAIIHQLTDKSGKEKARLMIQKIGKGLLSIGGKAVESHIGVSITAALAKGELDILFDKYESLENLKNQLTDMVEQTVGNKGTGLDRIVVFVDDLDRVKPERAVEILEVLKIFLDIPGLVLVLACDYEVILQGLKARAATGGEQVAGRSFFDKIIQVPFQMPSPSQEKLENFIGSLFKKVGASINGPDELKQVIEVLNNTTGTNPRTIKRLVNILNLLLLILDNDKHKWDDNVNNKAAIILTLVALQNAYPQVYKHLSSLEADDVFNQFTADRIKQNLDLKTLADNKSDNEIECLVDRLNQVLEIIEDLVSKDGVLLLRFISVSDLAVVQDRDQRAGGIDTATGQARSMINEFPEKANKLYISIITGLPELRIRKSKGFIQWHAKETANWAVLIKWRKRLRRLDFVFTATEDETVGEGDSAINYFEKMQEIGCPNCKDRYQDGSDFLDNISCSLPENAKPEEVLAVKEFVRWFITEAPELE